MFGCVENRGGGRGFLGRISAVLVVFAGVLFLFPGTNAAQERGPVMASPVGFQLDVPDSLQVGGRFGRTALPSLEPLAQITTTPQSPAFPGTVVPVAANSGVGIHTGPLATVSVTSILGADAPRVAITMPSKINKILEEFLVTFTFSEEVSEFNRSADLTVVNAISYSLSGSGATYTLRMRPEQRGKVVVTVKANSVTDKDGNTGPPDAVSATAKWDVSSPHVFTDMPAKINSKDMFTAKFRFTEAITGFEIGDVNVTGGTKGVFAGSDRNYTLEVTPSGGKNVSVTVTAHSVTDGLNTGPLHNVQATTIWDVHAPGLPLTGIRMPAKINSEDMFTVNFRFTEAVTGFEKGDVDVTGGMKGAFAGNGSSYTLEVTPVGGQNVSVTVTAHSVTDGLHTGPGSDRTAMAIWDVDAPTVKINGIPSKINSRDALDVTFTFSEDVTEFVAGDVNVVGGTKGMFSGTGDTYTLRVTPFGGENVVVRVPANSVTDGLYTGPPSAVSAETIWDVIAPDLESIATLAKINSTDAFTATITFTEDVIGFDIGDMVVTGGTKGAFAGKGRRYTLEVMPAGGQDVWVRVKANSVTDGAGNIGPRSSYGRASRWDADAPTVKITGVPPTLISMDAFTATFTFSEDVTGFVAEDVDVTGANKGVFSGSRDAYTLLVTPIGQGNVLIWPEVVVTVEENSATDGAGNVGPPNDVSAKAIWDEVPPTVMITGVPSTINSTDMFTATFTFSEDVTGFATEDVTVTGGEKGTFTANSGLEYTLDVTPSGGRDMVVEVASHSATDGVGNVGPPAAVSATATWDSD
ncbi:MAG: hypothetical protein F4Z62_06170, partial [Rhodothermaceae bacterium]|nr:hypothetical protein [Rhodothermaceae bacterium]